METKTTPLRNLFNYFRGRMPDGHYDASWGFIRLSLAFGVPVVIASQIAAANGFTLDNALQQAFADKTELVARAVMREQVGTALLTETSYAVISP